RRVRVDEALWEALTKEYEAAKVEEVKQIPTVHVLDIANVPQRKSAPTRWLIMVVGTTVSFVVACLLVLLMNLWQQMDPQEEPKKIVTEALDAFLHLLRR
ncbi:MAG: GNVR domain-containing protein, partial [Puia sp.]|nr:GNVR domain-containing protein [Puia sp.]